MKESEQKMIELSGIDQDKIRIYRVGFEFNQSYDQQKNSSFEYKNFESEADMGLVAPMVDNPNVDPYTKRKIKPIPNKIRASCC